jgi:Zn-dependent metalloprotease
MKNEEGKIRFANKIRLFAALAAIGAVIAVLAVPFSDQKAATVTDPLAKINQRPAPIFDLNKVRGLADVRTATDAQIAALNNLKTSVNAPNMTFRWNNFGGSPDVMYDFASQPFDGTPEEAARSFISQNAGLFGVPNIGELTLFNDAAALGGHLLRFNQTFNGLPVQNGGIGIILNGRNQVIMASGPFFRDVNLNTTPTLDAAQARAAADEDLARYAANIPAAVSNLLQTGLAALTAQAAPIANLEPKLGIYPTSDGYRLVWKVAKFSTNPFGLYVVSIDAHTGETVARRDFVTYQQAPAVLPFTGDIYPKYPRITQELKDQGIISVCGDKPCDQVRANLRKFDASNVVTGLNGTLTGTHTVVNNALATKQPFAQAALGTWHFAKNDPLAFEARTNEQDQFAEPAEHQDEINAFFFTTYLLEYVDHIHKAGDPGTFGSTGAFPDTYPNSETPLPATVHIPDVVTAIQGEEYPPPDDPEFVQKVLGLDNAFALNLTPIIEEYTGSKSPVVVNPTAYGHGFLYNDTALEGTVPYHEGMHAITSPIAGWEGSEGGAMNEGQADSWAFTITDNASLGDYVINGFRLRQAFRDIGRDPDSVGYIRSARSSLKYSDYGTYTGFGGVDEEEHRDGEIFMSTMWDIREVLNWMYPQNTLYKRPQASDGLPVKQITKGTNIYERLLLGQAYVLGTTSPDTLVKARDAMIIADMMLYSTNPTNETAPGYHRALIEQVWAAKEMGVNAREFSAGKVTISTQVTPFAGDQAAPAAPQGVQAVPNTTRSMRVSWNSANGAVAYEVLKRKTALAGRREGNPLRASIDGDAATTGFRHVAFVNGSSLTYVDNGRVAGAFTPAGISNLFDSEYVVRAIGVNASGQVGFSDLSGSSRSTQTRQDLTAQVDSAISNISFVGSTTSFDNKLTNARGAFSTDKTIYTPIEFQVVSISTPSVTVKNADSGGNTWVYNTSLALGGQTSAKRMEFNNPMMQLFTFDARIYGNAFAGNTIGTGSSGDDGTDDPPPPVTYSLFTETRSGALLAGEPAGNGVKSNTWGDPAFKGITWDDVPITTKSDAIALEASLTASGAAIDMDFELRTTDGQVITRSAGATFNEFVSAAVQPNTTYILRVLGWANAASTYQITATQLLPENSSNANAGTRTSSGSILSSSTTTAVAGLFRFTVDPLTKKITFVRLK